VLPDDTWFYPGHGDDSTMSAERTKLAEWRKRGWRDSVNARAVARGG
jgi:glyoxylase-like metal-dependent hydrolase (beta-lactamase superfamily II)